MVSKLRKQKMEIKSKMSLLKKFKSISPDSLCEIGWLDIISERDKTREDLEHIPLEELLVKCRSYGKIHSFNTHGVILLTQDDGSEVDYTVIPLGVITSVREYKPKGGKYNVRY